MSKGARKTQLRALLFLALALMAGLGAVVLVQTYLERAQRDVRESAVAQVPTVSIVVATSDLRIGAVLGPQDLRTVQWPEDHVPEDSLGILEDALGRAVVRDVVAGVPIVRRQLSDHEHGDGLAALLANEGTRAMTVSVDRVIGVSGFIQPGDFVDVISTMSPDAETREALDIEPGRVSKIVLQNIRVLAVGDHVQSDRREPRPVQAVTLQVHPEESERLALATDYGRIQLTLRSPADQILVSTPGITPLGLLLDDEAEPADLFVRTRRWLENPKPAPQPPPRVSTPRRRPALPEVKESSDEKEAVIEMLRGSREVESRTLRRSENP